MTELVVLAAVVVVVGAASWWWRVRRGALRESRDSFHGELVQLDVPPGARAIVEFTTPWCRDCDAARAVVEQAAAPRDDVVVRTVDAATSGALARAHGVQRAPTVFLLEPGGHVARRIVGVPRADALAAALDHAADRAGRT